VSPAVDQQFFAKVILGLQQVIASAAIKGL
jgi:hypothetical protein